MRVVFMGTPAFAATILDDLAEQHDVAAVYTRPDAVRGRGKRLEPSPVKAAAERRGLRVLTPRTLRDEAAQRELASFAPDVICVAAYGAILPKEVLDIPRFGCLNVHASLLPRWRGAAPIERAILAGVEEAGVCIMRMEEGLDTGAYCVCRTAIVDGKSASELTDELADLGSHALLTALVHVERGAAEWTEQDASPCSKRTRPRTRRVASWRRASVRGRCASRASACSSAWRTARSRCARSSPTASRPWTRVRSPRAFRESRTAA